MTSVSLFFDIFGRDKGVNKMLDNVGDKAKASDAQVGKLGKGLGALAGPLAVAGAGAAAVFATGFAEAKDASAMTAQLEAGIRSTGNAAGVTVDGMNALAAEIQSYSGQTDDSIANTQALLLTFTNIKNAGPDKIFDETTRAAADMAARLGGDASQQAMVLGKALNDPINGVSKLQRVGVSFTEAQKATIKRMQETGDVAGAQKVILAELNKEFGGSAKAAGESLPGQLAKGQRSFEDMSQKLVTALLPALLGLTGMLTEAAKWVTENSDLVMTLGAVLGVLAVGIGVVTAAQWLFNVAAAANPIGLVILAVTALVAIIAALAMNWDKVTKFLGDSWNKFTQWWGDGMNRAGKRWNDFWGGVGGMARDTWSKTLGPVFNTISDFVTKKVPKAFRDGVGFIRTAWNGVREAAKAPIRFVVNTVINDGVIGTFNTVAGWLGIAKLGRVALPQGFMTGGYTGDGDKMEPKGVVHGGEFVLTKDQTRKAGVANLYRLARMLDGFAQGGFVHPVPSAVVSQPYSATHNGIDLAAPYGTPIRAAYDGTITQAAWSPYGGGNEIHIRHAAGWETWYAHLSRMLVRAGQVINRGMRIGDVGSTGNSTGNHLHYMVLRGGWPNHVNPAPFMGAGDDIPTAGFNPFTGIFDIVLGGLKNFLSGTNVMGKLVGGMANKLIGGVGDFLMGKGTGGLSPKVFDSGGWLETVGVNRSGQPEAVLTGAQWDIMRQAAGTKVIKVYVENPWTGEYMEAKMEAVADRAIDGADSDLYRGRAR